MRDSPVLPVLHAARPIARADASSTAQNTTTRVRRGLFAFLVALPTLLFSTSPATAAVLLAESFTYPDGSLNAKPGWATHSGTAGQMQVTGGRAIVVQAVSGTASEDVNVDFAPQSTSAKTYASFTLVVTDTASLALAGGNYFAHFKKVGDTSLFRTRVYVARDSVTPGYKVGLGATSVGLGLGEESTIYWPGTFGIGQSLRIVTSYNAATGTSELWINPTDESSTKVTRTVLAAAGVDVGEYALRQGGSSTHRLTETVDNLSVGTSFSDIVSASPTLSILDVTKNEGNANKTSFDFLVTMPTKSLSDVTVGFSTKDGTADSRPAGNDDYQATSGVLTIPAGQSSGIISVSVNGDLTVERNEDFFVNLFGASNADIADGEATGTILNDDLVSPTLNITDVKQQEGDNGKTEFIFTVSLTGRTDTDVTVDFITKDGTAQGGGSVHPDDYQSTSGTLTIKAKSLSGTISVSVNGDQIQPDPNPPLDPASDGPTIDEFFLVNLSNLSPNAQPGDMEGRGEINNDDGVTATALTMFQAEPISEGVELRWQFAAASRFDRVLVERGTAASGPWSEVTGSRRTDGDMTVLLDAGVEPGQTYFYRLQATDPDGQTTTFGPFTGTAGTIMEFALSSVWPNPSKGTTQFAFAVASVAHVNLRVFDIQGREVAVLANGVYRPGRYQASWNPQAGSAGVYFVRYQTPKQSFVRRVVINP